MDVDDTVKDTRSRLLVYFNRIFGKFFPDFPFPTLDDARKIGIRRSYLSRMNELGIDESVYDMLMEMIRGREYLYGNASLVHEDIPKILEQLEQKDIPTALYLTAREESVTKHTREDLIVGGMPDRPVYAESRGDVHTPKMKTEIAMRFANRFPGIPIITIDDNQALAEHVHKENHPHHFTILLKNPRAREGDGIIIAEWPEIPGVIERLLGQN